MQTVVRLNEIEIPHKDGVVYIDNLSETLDSGVVVCEGVDKLDITPIDGLYIKFPNANLERKMVVASFEEEIASYNPRKYNYTIQYVSPTLLTERITLPNLSIKKVYKTKNDEEWLIKEGDYYVRSVAYYIYQYMNEYFNLGLWAIDETIESKAKEMVCPEMSFDRPTLKEVLNTLLQTIDYVFYLDAVRSISDVYFVSGLNPNIDGNAIDTSKLDRDIVRQDAKFYASNLDVELTNSISNKLTKSIQYITPRTDDAILTTDNAALFVQEPIYALEKVELHCGAFNLYDATNNKVNLNWVDITKYVVEKSVYDSLLIRENGMSYLDLYKINTIYYTQGDNKIEGLGKSEKVLALFDSGTALQNLLFGVLPELGVPMTNSNINEIGNTINSDLVKLMFRITYQTQQDVKMQTEKAIKNKHNSSLFDSQNSKFVNVELFSKNSLDTINKLGNPERTINAFYNNFNEIPQLGDYIDDYILTTRTISIYDDYIVFEGLLTKNYADKYQFNAIDSKKRFYNISDESLVRHELIKKYCVFEYKQDNNVNELSKEILNFNNYISEYATLTFDLGNNETSKQIMREVSTYQEGNSVGITFGFNDNIIAGNSRGEKDTGGYYQEPVKYVNEYGENYGVKIDMYKNMYDKTFADKDAYLTYSNTTASYFPVARSGFDIFSDKLYSVETSYHKDQSEIQRWTIQYTFVSNDDRIIVGTGFYNQNCFANNITIKDFKIVKYNKKFNIRNNQLDNNSIVETITNSNLEIGNNYYKIKGVSGNIGIVLNNELILGVNNYAADTPIYLNIRDKR